jgi:hypothetical protein
MKKDSIIVGFSNPKKWWMPFSLLIRLVTWCKFSHAYIRYENTYAKRSEVFQAKGLLLNFIGQTLFDAEENVYAEFEIPISKKTKLKTVKFAIDNVGKPYAVIQIIGFVWVMLANLFGQRVRNPFYSKSSYFCSELVTTVLDDIKSVDDDMDPSTATPKDVYEFLIKNGYKPISGKRGKQRKPRQM